MDALMLLTAAAETAPAGGATAGQIAIGGGIAVGWTVLLLLLGHGHRTGRSTLLNRMAAPLERATGLPGWATLPVAVAVVGFLLAGPGFAWDVALHMSKGRDEGPFANPSHFMIFGGLLVLLASGWLAVVLPKGDVGPSGVRIAPSWSVPAGGIAMLLCASAALLAFPLDDFWHRAFGQDVTLWGPTHLVLITGGLLVYVSSLVLVREGRASAARLAALRGDRAPRPVPTWLGALAASIVLAGLTLAYQQEFGYGAPQFRTLFHPVLIAMAATLALVTVRLACGPGAALLTVVFAGVVDFALTGLVGPVLGDLTLHFPTYVAEGALVELAALALLRDGRSPYLFATASAVLIGTLGVLAEFGWSHVWMPLSWPAHIVAPAMVRAVPLAIACGVLAVFVARCLGRSGDPAILGRWAWAPPAAAVAVTLAVLGSLLPSHAPDGARVALTLTDAGNGTANVVARFTPRDVAEDADRLQGLSWQSGEGIVTAPLERVSEGVYRTTEPLEVSGSAKAMIRLQRGTTTASVAVRFPADAAIPAPAVPALAQVERPLVHDPLLLQRERKPDTPRWLWSTAATAVLALVLTLLGTIGWALLRIARGPLAPAGARGAAAGAGAGAGGAGGPGAGGPGGAPGGTGERHPGAPPRPVGAR
ncbi:hypothetical protein [Conexibacter woesei]|nr:hypothetical protein [Conexibacter woesei]